MDTVPSNLQLIVDRDTHIPRRVRSKLKGFVRCRNFQLVILRIMSIGHASIDGILSINIVGKCLFIVLNDADNASRTLRKNILKEGSPIDGRRKNRDRSAGSVCEILKDWIVNVAHGLAFLVIAKPPPLKAVLE